MKDKAISKPAQIIHWLSSCYYYWRFVIHLRYLARRLDQKL